MRVIEPKFNGSSLAPVSDDAKEIADALFDALSELAGKRLDRPTAHSLGKLFQKRLVDRPAWILNGETVAILRKSPGHNENDYWVDVSALGLAPDRQHFDSDAADTRKNIPQNPHIPPGGGADDGKVGNVGKDGNVFAGTSQPNGIVLDNGATKTPAWRARL